MRASLTKHHAALLAATLGWGSATAINKYALGGFPPFVLLVVQLLSAVIVLWAALLQRGLRPPRFTRKLMLLGVLEPGLAYVLILLGVQRTTAANGALVLGLESFVCVLLAWAFLHERITARGAGAVLFAMVGFAIMQGLGSHFSPHLGDLLVLSGVVCAATYIIVAAQVAPETDPLTMTTYQFTAGLLFLLPAAAVIVATGSEHLPSHVHTGIAVAAILSGVVNYALPFLAYNYAIHAVGPLTAAMSLNLMPVVGVVCAIAFLAETLTTSEAAGGAVIMVAVALFTGAQAERPEPLSGPAPVMRQ
jgi:drug/metabolite transporter (DMT)-like permease